MDAQTPKTWKDDPIPPLIIVGLSIGILICLYRASLANLTTTESVLLGILLSAASMLVSWLVTAIYSKANLDEIIKQATAANTESIRNYAVKAAEKVLNLSNELQRLIDALTTASDDAEELEHYKETAALLEERISAAIHILETLRSMNDTFLSDWRGVIGEEIARQHVLEAQIADLAKELEEQRREKVVMAANYVSPADIAAMQKRMDETTKLLTEKLVDLPFRVNLAAKRRSKKDVVFACPSCGTDNTVSVRTRRGGKKLTRCTNCESYYQIGAGENEEAVVVPIAMYSFKSLCPVCMSQIVGELPDYQSAVKNIVCPSCDFPLSCSRASNDVNIKIVGSTKKDIPQKLFSAVIAKIPPRPWPIGFHKALADEMGLPYAMVSRIIGIGLEKGILLSADESPANEQGVHDTMTDGQAT